MKLVAVMRQAAVVMDSQVIAAKRLGGKGVSCRCARNNKQDWQKTDRLIAVIFASISAMEILKLSIYRMSSRTIKKSSSQYVFTWPEIYAVLKII